MRAALLVAVVACGAPQPVARAPVSEASFEGTAVLPGEMKVSGSVEIVLGVVLPEDVDPATIEARGRQLDASLDISRSTLDRFLEARTIKDHAPRHDGLRELVQQQSPTVLVVRGAGNARAVVGAVAGTVRTLASEARGWVADPVQEFIFDASYFETRLTPDATDVRHMIAVNNIVHDRVMYMRTAGLRRYGYFDLYIPVIDPKQRSPLMELLVATAQHIVNGGDVDKRGRITVDVASVGRADYVKGGTGIAVWHPTWGTLPSGERVVELHADDGSDPDAYSYRVLRGQ